MAASETKAHRLATGSARKRSARHQEEEAVTIAFGSLAHLHLTCTTFRLSTQRFDRPSLTVALNGNSCSTSRNTGLGPHLNIRLLSERLTV